MLCLFQFSVDTGSDNDRLETLCPWSQHFRLCRGVRRKWRQGGEQVTPLITDHIGGLVTCYDCQGDTVCLGTSKGDIVSWNTRTDQSKVTRCVVTRSRVDKVYTRYNMVIVMQGGLVQVFNADSNTETSFQLLYCKSVEQYDKNLLPSVDNLPPEFADDNFYIPTHPLKQLQKLYKPLKPLKYSDYDITVSTVGVPLLCVAKSGDRTANIYSLTTGVLLDTLEAEPGDSLLKIGLVSYESHCTCVYNIVRDMENRLVGTMYDLELKSFLWRLYLDEVFSYDFSVYSVYTSRGMLMFGRQAHDTGYPYTWTWRGWSYRDGSEFYRTTFETEFGMCLADWSEECLVTPRDLSYLYTCDNVISFTQRYHRGVNVLAYSWNNTDSTKNKKVCFLSLSSSFVESPTSCELQSVKI